MHRYRLNGRIRQILVHTPRVFIPSERFVLRYSYDCSWFRVCFRARPDQMFTMQVRLPSGPEILEIVRVSKSHRGKGTEQYKLVL